MEKASLPPYEDVKKRPVRGGFLGCLAFFLSLSWLAHSFVPRHATLWKHRCRHDLRTNERDIIAWAPCPDMSWQHCAYLNVPRDYSARTDPSDTVSIALRKIPATAPRSQQLGSVLLNPGGPSGSGTNAAIRLGPNMQVVLDGRYSIIGFDPRSVNQTLPENNCFEYEDDEIRAGLEEDALGLPLDSRAFAANISSSSLRTEATRSAEDAYWRRVDAHYQKRAMVCGQHGNMGVLTSSSTALVARDMLSIVEALGEDKITYWGYSYGTVLGATFASMFPNRIHRLVLDGVVDSVKWYEDPLAWGKESIRDSDKVLDGLVKACVEAGPERCALAKEDQSAEDLHGRLAALRQRLLDQPLPVAASVNGGGVVTASTLKLIIFSVLYKPKGWPATAKAIAELERGNGTLALDSEFHHLPRHRARSRNVFNRPLTLEHALRSVSSTIIMCADQWAANNAEGASDLSMTEYARQLEDVSDSIGDAWAQWLLACRRWPFKPIETYANNFDSLNKTSFPILFVSNTFDPVTPVHSGRTMAKLFGNASLLIQDAYGHCSLTQPSSCTARAIRDYFIDGVLPAYGTTCPSDAQPFQDGPATIKSAEDARLSKALEGLAEAF